MSDREKALRAFLNRAQDRFEILGADPIEFRRFQHVLRITRGVRP